MSEIEIGPSSRFDSIKSNAYWTRVNFDTTMWPSTGGRDDYAAHLWDCINNPTQGFIARRQYITGKPMNYPEYAKRNKLILDYQPEMKPLIKALNKKVKKLYPRTRFVREYIINDDRLSLEVVKKSRKYTKFDRTMIFSKSLFHV